MIITMSKTFDFDAAHFLPNVADGHKCKRLHGHTYRVELILCGQISSESGWFIDYGDIADAWKPLHDDVLDHRCLNDIEGLENPTTENLCGWILRKLADKLPHLARVRVYESSSTWCEVTRIEAMRFFV